MSRFFLLLSFLLVCHLICAQSIGLGIEGGFTYGQLSSNLTGLERIMSQGGYGFYAGVNLEFPVSDKVRFKPGLGYLRTNNRLHPPDPAADLGVSLDYLTLPLQLDWYFLSGLALSLGPRLGWLFSHRLSRIDRGTDMQAGFRDALRSLDLSLKAGLRYEWAFGLYAEAAYSHGLANILSPPFAEAQTRIFQLGLGWMLRSGNSQHPALSRVRFSP